MICDVIVTGGYRLKGKNLARGREIKTLEEGDELNRKLGKLGK